ncbi:type II toxin-antitoxin system PemK/MazF family toxin [Pantoea vagans]|uniref:type II toxin-antitoxin system PemK/MazF family toxin n=1 Tax=Pantoea vagans TaxID=470934 RepID=UPI0028AA47DC|nr:type II toxin-antitoxin system PemK/MazF family toxin [Pantoea vagans]
MAAVTIKYFLLGNHPQNDQLLGFKSVENIEEVLVPINLGKKKIPFFITLKFSGRLCTRWRVEFVASIEKNIFGIWLTEQNTSDDCYLSTTLAIRKITNASQVIRPGTIVIVEYGHIYKSLNFTTGLSDSMLYPCSNQEGEMHKRRPAIVVSADARGAKVVPITSSQPQGFSVDRSIFELESTSTEFIAEFRPGSKSYALCHMIQNISFNRILPPLARPYNSRVREFSRDVTYQRRITKNDLAALETGLLTGIGMAALKKKNDTLYAKLQQNTSVIDDLTQKNQELESIKARYECIKRLYMETAALASDDEVESEITDWLKEGFDD